MKAIIYLILVFLLANCSARNKNKSGHYDNYLISEKAIGSFIIERNIENYDDPYYYQDQTSRIIYCIINGDTLYEARYGERSKNITAITTNSPRMHLENGIHPGMSISEIRKQYPIIDASIQPRIHPIVAKASVVFVPPEYRRDTIGNFRTLYLFLKENDSFTDTILYKISVMSLIEGF